MKPPILFNRCESDLRSVFGPMGLSSGGETFPAGEFGNAIQIDADGEYLGFDGPTVLPDVDEYCVEWLYKPFYNIVNGIAADNQHCLVTVLANPGIWERGSIYFYIQAAGGTVCYFRNAADDNYLGIAGMTDISYNVTANTWVHMAIVRSNGENFDGEKTMAFYVNGAQVASDTENGSAKAVAGKKVLFGANNGTAGQHGNGIIDNVKIWPFPKCDFSDRQRERGGLNDQLIAV